MPKIKVVITVRNCVKYIRRTLNTVREQFFTDWVAVVIDDVSDDGTFDILSNIEEEDSRITVLRNSERMYQLKNIETGILKNAPLEDDVIVVSLDGGDWLTSPDVFDKIVEAHKSYDITWGSYVIFPKGDRGHCSDIGNAKPYEHPFCMSHLKTYKQWVFRSLDKNLFIDSKGKNYYKYAGDTAVMIPAVTFYREKATYIPDLLYAYNTDSFIVSDHSDMRSEQFRIEAEVKEKVARLMRGESINLLPQVEEVSGLSNIKSVNMPEEKSCNVGLANPAIASIFLRTYSSVGNMSRERKPFFRAILTQMYVAFYNTSKGTYDAPPPKSILTWLKITIQRSGGLSGTLVANFDNEWKLISFEPAGEIYSGARFIYDLAEDGYSRACLFRDTAATLSKLSDPLSNKNLLDRNIPKVKTAFICYNAWYDTVEMLSCMKESLGFEVGVFLRPDSEKLLARMEQLGIPHFDSNMANIRDFISSKGVEVAYGENVSLRNYVGDICPCVLVVSGKDFLLDSGSIHTINNESCIVCADSQTRRAIAAKADRKNIETFNYRPVPNINAESKSFRGSLVVGYLSKQTQQHLNVFLGTIKDYMRPSDLLRVYDFDNAIKKDVLTKVPFEIDVVTDKTVSEFISTCSVVVVNHKYSSYANYLSAAHSVVPFVQSESDYNALCWLCGRLGTEPGLSQMLNVEFMESLQSSLELNKNMLSLDTVGKRFNNLSDYIRKNAK